MFVNEGLENTAKIITNYQIEMLDVQDADAFIIFYEENSRNTKLILVDAGRYSDRNKIATHLRKYYPHKSIDLAIVTHCDEDHFGGFVYLLEKNYSIKQFWINIPKNHKDKTSIENNKDLDSVYSTDVNEKSLNLIELIESKKIPHYEKFSYSCVLEYPYFHILGPTKEYYGSLLSGFRFGKKIPSEIISVLSEESKFEKSLSPALDNADDDNSAHNRSSIIFTFEPERGKKYLFMGDANKEAFDHIPEEIKERYAKDVYWLKVPHHGSEHNLDSDMVEFIQPKIAYVSTAKIDKYLSRATVNALSSIGCKVYSTHKDRSNFLHNGFDGREGYSPAVPFNQKQLENDDFWS